MSSSLVTIGVAQCAMTGVADSRRITRWAARSHALPAPACARHTCSPPPGWCMTCVRPGDPLRGSGRQGRRPPIPSGPSRGPGACGEVVTCGWRRSRGIGQKRLYGSDFTRVGRVTGKFLLVGASPPVTAWSTTTTTSTASRRSPVSPRSGLSPPAPSPDPLARVVPRRPQDR